MKSILAAGLAVLALMCVTPAWAQQAAGNASAENRALARRVVDITTPDFDKQILAHMREAVAEARLAELDPEVGRWMEKNAGPMLLPHMRQFMEEIIELYARRFTSEELGAMVAFYETPLGRAIADKQVSIGIETGGLIEPLMQRYAEDLFKKLCDEIDCGAAGAGNGSSAKSTRR
ncbi:MULTISPECIES: DUF2059 domain-containing protein [unclassified Brevundimonas]|uniref:DUF2059 domain-containing protein n=1 Tax=unclassified Brevundimonas TaxID=2622653 RepID=UPI0025BDFE0B|nr:MULTISPECIES: DUF2059 domain-containing protein [unclassified Brevundimonas]